MIVMIKCDKIRKNWNQSETLPKLINVEKILLINDSEQS